MTILLTGANGQVGWEVVRQARERGIALAGLTRKELDVTDSSAIEEIMGTLAPRVVINAAAYTAVDRAEAEPDAAFAVNARAPGLLAAACRRRSIPLIHLSTDYVFDGTKGAPYEEDDPVNPLGVYGKSKAAGEEAVRDALEQHLIFRTSWVFGSHGANFVKTVLRLARQSGPLRIVDDQQGAPTSAQSIADCLLTLVERYRTEGSLPWGSYHFSGAPSTSWHGFAVEILRQGRELGMVEGNPEVRPITTAEFPTPAPRPMDARLNGSRARELLGCPPGDWESDLGQVLRRIAAAE